MYASFELVLLLSSHGFLVTVAYLHEMTIVTFYLKVKIACFIHPSFFAHVWIRAYDLER